MNNTSLLLVLFLSLLALSHADLYGNPSPPVAGGLPPPPPFAVKGKEFRPESSLCLDPTAKCFNQAILCPGQCPNFKPADPKAKACFVDCKKCETVCLHRKPNCEGNGAACYDPRFVGGDGIMFYFHGKSDHHFSLVSDRNLQINARFIGHRPVGRTRDFTWIQALGFMFDSHTFTMEAKKVSIWDNDVDHFVFTYDGMLVDIDSGHLSTWSSPDSELAIDRTARSNSITVILPRVFEIRANVVPVTVEDDRIHKYGIPSGNSFAHLEVQFNFFRLSEKVEGVLGQTYRPGFRNPVKSGVPMPVMSGEDRYMTSSLFSADCKYCIFSPEQVRGSTWAFVSDPTATAAMDCTSKRSNAGVVCRR